jgi:hypothetical protein
MIRRQSMLPTSPASPTNMRAACTRRAFKVVWSQARKEVISQLSVQPGLAWAQAPFSTAGGPVGLLPLVVKLKPRECW